MSKNKQLSWNAQASKELHRPIQHHFQTRKYFISGLDFQWTCDLVDLQKYAADNKKLKWILVCVDVFSRFLWLRALENKKQVTVKKAFENIFATGPKPKRCVLTDLGIEFCGTTMKSFWEENDIELIHNFGINKSAMAENMVKNVKGALFRLMTTQNSHNWFQFLEKVEYEHNFVKKQKILRMTPSNARLPQNNYSVMKANMKKPKIKKNRRKGKIFKLGQCVRIAKSRHVFKKGYEESWTREQFKIRKILQTFPRTYYLKDLHNKDIIGCFYPQELQASSQKVFFHNVIKKERDKKTRKNKILVSWEGWPESHNSWVDEDTVVDPEPPI